MADFGLAAQIGRGGGGGMPAPVDPANRMMQLLQMQQLQQNMLLAREQNAREAALAPLRMRNIEADIAATGARTTATGEQTRRYRAEADVAERENLAQKGVLEFTANVPPAERTNPERLDELRKRNPGAFSLVSESIARMRKLDEDARAAGMSATQKMFEMQRAGLQNMSSLLPAITNEKEFRAFYDDYKVLDPAGARLITPEFNDKNLRAITARIQDRQDLRFETDAFGNEFVVNTRTGVKEPVTAARPAAPAASTFGNLAAPLAAPPAAATQVIGPGAAGLASPNAMLAPGEMPIIQPRAAAPEAAALGPRAAAEAEKTRAVETAKGDVGSEARRRGATEVLNVLSDPGIEKLIQKSTSGYLQRGAAGTIASLTGVATSGMENIGQLETIAGDITMRLLGGKLGAGISNKDVELIQGTLADIGNPNKPANQRLAAFRQLKKNLESIASGKPIQIAPGSASGSAAGGEVDMSNPLLGGRR